MNIMNILNYTPHVINLVREDGSQEVIPSSGVARSQEIKNKVGEVNGFPVYVVTYGELTGLPEQADDTVLVVSGIAAYAAKAAGRTDCRTVSDTVRNDAGQIIGAKALAIV